ncbi:MAG: M28 family peptidase [Dehalococcoidia bacterium]|nr:M28 family peptidase [Dehalococcoidia bacterium]
MRHELIPDNDAVFRWVEQIFAQGERRPGSPADRWTERFCLERFRELGLENVRAEPVELPYWEPRRASVTAWRDGPDASRLTLECFPLPHTAPGVVEGPLARFDFESPDDVRGRIALRDESLVRIPHKAFTGVATWHYDPRHTMAESVQVMPFAPGRQLVADAAIDAGALAFIGSILDFPGDSYRYYVPYDGVARPVPAVWIRGSDGARLREMLAAGPVRARIEVDAERHMTTSDNVIGELPGEDEQLVIVGSHHDGPWASAVEDASGVALVLAQAEYWSRVPPSERPHRMLFLLTTGHMTGGIGTRAFIKAHEAELERTVLEVHLEHAAAEFAEKDGRLEPTGLPEARWWFTSRNAALEDAVRSAIEAERLERSLILPPAVFGERPPTDAGAFHPAGVPLVSFLTAPFYLFDAMDTLDKIDREHLAAITRAAVRIIESTRGQTAESMRREMRSA